MLEVRNLKTYFYTRSGVVRAVDGISFGLERGKNLGIVGESGCGKSVTVMSILRLVPPPGRIVEGEIVFAGKDLLKKSESEMRKIRGGEIAVILQDPLTSLNPAYSIGNQIGEAIKIHQGLRGKPLIKKIIEALELVKIPAASMRIKNYPHQMSGGMRQRVCGAIGLSCQARLLIADEPTTSLDVTIQAQYLDLLKEIQSETDLSIVFVTHDFGIVARMCDTVAVMYAGKIVEIGKVRDIFNNPSHPYTKALLNCLPKIGADIKLSTIEGDVPDLKNLPKGCAFLPRCVFQKDLCYENMFPPEVELGEGHKVKCWLGGSN